MKGSTRQIPGASFIWSCFVQNRAFILCPLKCDFRPLDIAWQPCVRLPRNIATRSRFYSRRSANTYPSLESDHKNDPYHGKTGQHALTSNKIFFSKSPVFAVHRGIVRHLPAEHKIQSLPVRIPPAAPRRSKVRFAPTSFYACGKKDVIRPLPCSSFPTATRCAGLAVGGPPCGRHFSPLRNIDFNRPFQNERTSERMSFRFGLRPPEATSTLR